MKTLKLINIETDEVLNEEEISPLPENEQNEKIAMWQMQVELYRLDGISARFEIVVPEPEPIPE